MAEQYYYLRKEKKNDEFKIMRMTRQISNQERIILEMQEFMGDSLSDIFKVVQERRQEIYSQRRKNGLIVDLKTQDDPFGLYSSYIKLVKPLDYHIRDEGYRAEIEELTTKL